MKILIIADTHDHVADMQKVIEATKGNVDVVLHAGDACAPFMYRLLSEFEVSCHIVWGNCNDKEGAKKKCPSNVTLHGDTADLTLDGKKIFMNHYPANAADAASKAIYDVVVCGHTHVQDVRKLGTTHFINPGAVMNEKDIPPGCTEGICYVIYNTFTDEVEVFSL